MENLEWNPSSEVTMRDIVDTKEIDVNELDKPFEMEEVSEQRELSDEQKKDIIKDTGWSNQVVDCIGSIEEYQVYKEANLIELSVGEKSCLVREDIDMSQKDGFGRTNKERMEQGLAPLTKEGRPYELHHIGQHQDSPLAELTMQEHRGKGNDTILHIKTKESEINREEFGVERAEHWQNRVKEAESE